jgi:hypothetical protein
MLVGIIDQATFVSQQNFKGADRDYAIWLEQVRCAVLLTLFLFSIVSLLPVFVDYSSGVEPMCLSVVSFSSVLRSYKQLHLHLRFVVCDQPRCSRRRSFRHSSCFNIWFFPSGEAFAWSSYHSLSCVLLGILRDFPEIVSYSECSIFRFSEKLQLD